MRWAWLAALAALAATPCAPADPLRVGSKRFTESYVLAEIATRAAVRAGAPSQHLPGLGNTAILHQALLQGAIDVYPEYTGTIAREILREEADLDLAALNARLAPHGLAASVPFGFSNTYAIGVPRATAAARKLEAISQLAGHPSLRLGLSPEFLGRRDGWPGLARAYGLAALQPVALEHGLAYEALAAGRVDAIDLYATDAKIARQDLVVLVDDRRFFPRYDAVLLHRADLPQRAPAAWAALQGLAGRIDAQAMIGMNARAEIDGVAFAAVAEEFLGGQRGAGRTFGSTLFGADFPRLLWQHVALVAGAVLAAVIVGVPLGIAAARVRLMAQPVLASVGVVQTIPALALLALLIPLTGRIGVWPAMIALFLYALLPIVRNAHAGLGEVAVGQRAAALALGLTPRQSLRLVELPLALPTILAGVKTAAVVSVGTATIAAFIGAGGFGERISQGLALNDRDLLLAGALPAAGLALLVHALFEALERLVVRR